MKENNKCIEHERNLHQVDNAKKRTRVDYEVEEEEEEFSEGESVAKEQEENSIAPPSIPQSNFSFPAHPPPSSTSTASSTAFHFATSPIPSSITDASDLLPLNLPSFDDFLSSMDPLDPKDM